VTRRDPAGNEDDGARALTLPPSHEQLLAEVALEIQTMTQQKRSPLSGYRPDADGTAPGDQVLEELRGVQRLVAARAEPEEAVSG
jgi:hypothetical protein